MSKSAFGSEIEISTEYIQNCSAEDLSVWNNWHRLAPGFQSPFFSPQYFIGLSKFRKSIKILTIRQSGTLVAVLPYEEVVPRVGTAPGWPISDYNGIICDPAFALDKSIGVQEIVERANLDLLYLDKVPRAQSIFEPFFAGSNEVSYRVPIGQTPLLKKKFKNDRERSLRRFREKVGCEPELLYEINDARILNQLLAWKLRKTSETGVLSDFFRDPPEDFYSAFPWAAQFYFDSIESSNSASVAKLCALQANDKLLAGALLLVSAQCMHVWILAHDIDTRPLSPGILLLSKLLDVAPNYDIASIDMGCGDEVYKDRICTDRVCIDSVVIQSKLAQSEKSSGRRIIEALSTIAGRELSDVYSVFIHDIVAASLGASVNYGSKAKS